MSVAAEEKDPLIPSILKTTDLFLHEQLSPREAIKNLRKLGHSGVWFAGEVALSAAYVTGSGLWINKAANLFERNTTSGTDDGMRIMANYRLGQLELHRKRATTNEPVTTGELQNAFRETSERLEPFTRSSMGRKPNGEWTDYNGMLSEAAVGMLAMRAALGMTGKDDAPAEWLPIQSLLHQDQGGEAFIHCANSWDLSIFTEASANLTYKVQIKSVDKSPHAREYSDDITVVSVSPDLAVRPFERMIHSKIISSIAFEQAYPEKSSRVSAELDQRQDQLLDILG